MPLISIIVPIYNVEKYLKRCIDSVVLQKFDDYELILVDDGSKDGSPAICDNYKNYQQVRIIHKTNGGLVSARKEGAKIASGEYIACLDGDDWLSESYFTTIVPILKNKAPDVVCFSYNRVFEDGTVENNLINFKDGIYGVNEIKNEIYPILIENREGKSFSTSIWNKVYRSNLYKKVQLQADNKIKIGEDQAVCKPIIYESESMVVINKSLYNYRFNRTSMTNEKKSFDMEGPQLVGMHLSMFNEDKSIEYEQQVDRLVTHFLFNASISQFYKKEKYKTIKDYICSYLASPYYATIIRRCDYSIKNIKGKLALVALRHRLFFLMFLYSKLR